MRRIITIILLCIVGRAQASNQLDIVKTSGKIIFDGVCSPAEWDGLQAVPLQMFKPNYGVPGSERSEIYVTYDDHYFYLAGRCYFENGSKISSVTKKRDAYDEGNDMLGILFDSYNDHENGMGFITSPSGHRMDFNVFNDGQGSSRRMPFSPDWNTFWDVKTNIIDGVWHTEMRIPISSLRFEDRNGRVTMGITIWRYIASKVEFDAFPLMPNNLGPFSMWKPSKSYRVHFDDLKRARPIYLTPYGLAGLGKHSELNDQESAYHNVTDKKLDFGVDLKYGITSNLTMDLTVNTDFAQVEVDDEQINLTRFPLFFPEKRQFFLERNSTFRFKTNGPNTLFYSRRIGLNDGDIVPIYGGIRFVGRSGGWDYGLLDMQTAPIDGLASTNHGVFRIRKQILNENSYIGGMITNKLGTDGQYNTAYGLDGIFKMSNTDYLIFNYAQTFGDSLENTPISMKNGKYYLQWEKRSDQGFGYSFSVAQTGEDYNPELGYEWRDDYARGRIRLWYGWINSESSPLFKHSLRVGGFVYKGNKTFETETVRIDPTWVFETKKGFSGSIGYEYQYENVPDSFDISDDVNIPAGIYDFHGLTGRLSTPANKLFSVKAETYFGSYYDGTRIMVSPVVLFKPSSSLQLSLAYIFNYLDIPDRQQTLNAHIARLKTEIMLSTKLSGSFFVQYNGVGHVAVDNFRLRYNPREGNDLWLVYNDVMNTHRTREAPALPFTDSRTIILKYNHTFRMGR